MDNRDAPGNEYAEVRMPRTPRRLWEWPLVRKGYASLREATGEPDGNSVALAGDRPNNAQPFNDRRYKCLRAIPLAILAMRRRDWNGEGVIFPSC